MNLLLDKEAFSWQELVRNFLMISFKNDEVPMGYIFSKKKSQICLGYRTHDIVEIFIKVHPVSLNYFSWPFNMRFTIFIKYGKEFNHINIMCVANIVNFIYINCKKNSYNFIKNCLAINIYKL